LSHSKTKVNSAGEVLSGVLRSVIDGAPLEGERRLSGSEAMEIVEWWRGEHARPLSRVAANLRYYAAEEGKPVVAQRLKKVPTIAHKLLREPGMKLSRMGDIGGVRAVLPDQAAAYRVAARLRRNWTITRFRDYVATPKGDGYRALHLVNRHRGRLIEVQLRTPNQDWWANMMERVSRAAAPGLKFGGGPPEWAAYFQVAAEVLAYADQQREIPHALLKELKVVEDEVDTFIGRKK
jgi:putative GTP pyrophosphokinase